MKRIILAILFVTLMLNLSGCVVVDRQHNYTRRVVVESPPPGPPKHYPARTIYPRYPKRGQNRYERPWNRF